MIVNNQMLKHVEDYLTHRRCMGFSFSDDKEGVMLRSFAKYADGVDHRGPVTVELAVQWALRTKAGSSPIQRGRRLQLVRGFCQYRLVFDPDTEVPPKELMGPESWQRRAPYIYSDSEIAALAQVALKVRPINGLRPQTYATLLSLLACTGLRISEALALLREDVDLEGGVLTIKKAKGNKVRLVPVDTSAVEALRRYADFRDGYCVIRESETFFLNEGGRAMTYAQIHLQFTFFRHKLGWTDQSRPQRPRIHDLRYPNLNKIQTFFKKAAN